MPKRQADSGLQLLLTPNARKARLAIALGGLFMALGNPAKPNMESKHNGTIRTMGGARIRQA